VSDDGVGEKESTEDVMMETKLNTNNKKEENESLEKEENDKIYSEKEDLRDVDITKTPCPLTFKISNLREGKVCEK